MFLSAAGRGNTRYRRSFVATGFMTLITVPLAVIPFSPFTIHWFINPDRRLHAAFVYLWQRYLPAGDFIPALTRLFCSIPLPVVTVCWFLICLYSFPRWCLASNIPLAIFIDSHCRCCRHILMALPPVYLQDLPLTLRPLNSNGLLVGILLAVLMDNLIPWERIE